MGREMEDRSCRRPPDAGWHALATCGRAAARLTGRPRRWVAPLLLAGAVLLRAGLAEAAGDLVLYNWADYFPPDTLKRFEAETGIRVTAYNYDSNETLLAGIESGAANYDVIVPMDYMVRIMIDKGLLEPIDAASMPNFAKVRKPFDQPWFDPQRRYTAPNMWGTTGFSYDSAQVEGGRLAESWKEFFEPRPELVGKVVALDDELEVYRAAAYYLGIDPCTENSDDAQRILDLLQAQKAKLAFYSSGANAGTDSIGASAALVRSRTMAAGQGWDGDARKLQHAIPTMVYVVPKEGSSFWQDAYAVPVGAPHLENAKIFLNWVMAPKNIAEVSNFTGYTNAIEGAEPYMSPDLAKDEATNLSPAMRDRLRPVKACSSAARELADRVWTRLWPRNVK
jgi:spermidine/putrescine transport system substrate-binding protein